MSCCYCITRARSITACVDCSLQAKTVLSNSIFLHYTFFSLPKACVSHRCSSHTNITHVQQAAVAQGPSAPHTKWGGHGNLSGKHQQLVAVPCAHTKPTSPASSPWPRFCPKLVQVQEPKAKVWEQQGTTVPYQRDRIVGAQNGSGWKGAQGLTWCHPPASRAMPEHRMAARQLWNASSEEGCTPSLCPTSAAPSIALICWGHC